MIIIEGPDNAGKSSLAKKLSELLGIDVHHSGGPPKTDSEIMSRHYFVINGLIKNINIILDRVPCISDQVYGPLIRGYSPLESHHLALFVEHLKIPIIYCRPPTKVLMTVEEGHESHGHDTPEHIQGIKTHARAIISSYDKFISMIPHVTYDFTGEGSLVSVDDLVELSKL